MNQEHIIDGSSTIEHLNILTVKEEYTILDTLDDLEMDVEGDELLELLLKDMFDACLNYTRTVASMTYESLNTENGIRTEEYERISAVRGSIHDTTISAIKIFVRTMTNKNFDCNLTDGFFDNRGAYGKLALQITFSRLSRFNKPEII